MIQKLWKSVQDRNIDEVKRYLPHITNINSTLDLNCYSIMHEAAYQGHSEILQLIIDANGDINSWTLDVERPLHMAVLKNSVDNIRILIKHGAKLYAEDYDSQTALHKASELGHIESVRELLKHYDSDELDTTDAYDKTPLALSVEQKNFKIAEVLLDAGANYQNVLQSIINEEIFNGTGQMSRILRKRWNIEQAVVTFLGIMKKIIVLNAPTSLDNKIPRDIVKMMTAYIRQTRFDNRWEGA